ncbi:AAA family ATPase [Nocardia farcinica]|uniref:AAA family ATPase n=1 Tax=Nocardia farcinica TaxID=37329 RepID=UPI001B3C807E|nr:AAA family ATPase [Nocardia farcinica]MBF6539259.1 AAA family ATPase [Nocardia farcinica]
MDDDPAEPRAAYVHGSYFAHLAEVDALEPLEKVLDKSDRAALRTWLRKYRQPMPDTLADVEAMPLEPFEHMLELPSVRAVAADAAEQGLDDPAETFARWKADRAQWFRDRDAERRENAAEPKTVRAALLSVSDLARLPPPTPLVDGLLFAGTLAQLAGHPGEGKTFAVLGMSCAVALGKSWNGHAVPAPRPVVFVAGEGSAGMFTRLAAWAHHNGVPVSELDGKLHVLPRAAQLADPDDMRELTRVVRETGAGLVVFDTRARCTIGLEENSATDQGRAVAACDALIASTGATIAVVHHLGIGSQRGRGSSAWDGAVYSDLILGRNRDGGVLIECAKHKDAPDGCKHLFALEEVTVGPDVMPDADLRRRTSLVLTAADPLDGPGSATATAMLAVIVETAPPEGLTGAQIAAFAAERDICGKSTAYAVVKSLTLSGHLRNVGTPSRARYAPDPAGGQL